MNPDGEENWLTGWEQQCISSCDEQPDYEQILIKETDSTHRTVWNTFQDSATAIAQLYRGNCINKSHFTISLTYLGVFILPRTPDILLSLLISCAMSVL